MNKTEEDEIYKLIKDIITISENQIGRKFITETPKSSKSCQDCDEIKFMYYTLIKPNIAIGVFPESSRKSENELICSDCKNLREQTHD